MGKSYRYGHRTNKNTLYIVVIKQTKMKGRMFWGKKVKQSNSMMCFPRSTAKVSDGLTDWWTAWLTGFIVFQHALCQYKVQNVYNLHPLWTFMSVCN